MSFGNFIVQAGKQVFGMSNANNPNSMVPGYQTGQQQLQQPANNNSQIQSGNTGAADPNTDPQNNADPNKKPEGSQLDQFTGLWETPKDDKGQPIVQQDPLEGPIINLDPVKLKEAAGKINFAQGIDPETLQKAMSGQDPAAFMQVLNTVAQNSFHTAVTVTTKAAEEATQRSLQRMEAALPDRIRTQQIRQQQPTNPALSHPAVAPVMEGLKMTIAARNPHLSPERVANMAENYFLTMHRELGNTEQQQANANKKDTGPDWEQLLLNG
jgi:hypothetical protein